MNQIIELLKEIKGTLDMIYVRVLMMDKDNTTLKL